MKGQKFFKSLAVLMLFTLLFLTVATPARAFTPRSDDTVIIEADEVIADDLYVAGNSVIVRGTIQGDLIAVGSLVEVESSGVVEGDLIAAAQGVVVEGAVNGDVRIAGMSLVVGQGAQIGEDLLAFGFSLDVQQDTNVGQDLVVGAGMASLAGEIGRNVNAGVQGLQVDGAIGGDLYAEVGSSEDNALNNAFMMPQQPGVPAPIRVPNGLTVGPDAVISGDLTYTGREQGAVPAGAVAGETSYTQLVVEADGEVAEPAVSPLQSVYDWVVRRLRDLAALLLVGFIMAYFFPTVLREGADTVQSRPLPSLLWGLVAYAAFFFLIFLLVFLVVLAAVFLGIITLGNLVWTTLGLGALAFTGLTVSFHLAVSYVSKVIVGFLIGRWLVGLVRSDMRDDRFWPAVIGIVLFVLAASVPVLGWVVNLLVVLFGLGALLMMLAGRYSERQSPPLALQPQG